MKDSEDTGLLNKALAKMTHSQQAHLKLVVTELLACYTDDNAHGVLLIGNNESGLLKMITVNADDMAAAGLLQCADEYVNFRAMEDAPPKEMFN